MKNLLFAAVLGAASLAAHAQTNGGMNMPAQQPGAPLASPRHEVDATLGTAKVHISYGAPSLRGRKALGGELMPYTTWWRTGANEATTFETTGDVMVGKLRVPAGKYTLVSLPSAGVWQLVICKHTGQWGTERFEADDLGKVPMMKTLKPTKQELMSITFEKTQMTKSELHIRWENIDVSVPVSADNKGSLKTSGPAAHYQPLTASTR